MTPLHDVAVSAPHQLSVEFVEHAEFVLGATFAVSRLIGTWETDFVKFPPTSVLGCLLRSANFLVLDISQYSVLVLQHTLFSLLVRYRFCTNGLASAWDTAECQKYDAVDVKHYSNGPLSFQPATASRPMFCPIAPTSRDRVRSSPAVEAISLSPALSPRKPLWSLALFFLPVNESPTATA